jgi:uncharacterized membrane protein
MSKKLKNWLRITMIAALYATLTLVLTATSFGPVQVRIAEALTILPLLGFWPVWSLTLGCALSNLIGAALGFNLLGYWDVLWGSLATLIAAVLTYQFRNLRFRKIPVLSLLMPILVNGLVIGYELTFVIGPHNLFTFMFYMISVMIGESISVLLFGYPLYQVLRKTKLFKTEA